MSQIVVEVGKQMDGATFQLSPQTRAMLSSRSGQRLPASSIFVSGAKQALGTMRDPMLSHIVALLTGLTDTQIRELGFSLVNPTDSDPVRVELRLKLRSACPRETISTSAAPARCESWPSFSGGAGTWLSLKWMSGTTFSS